MATSNRTRADVEADVANATEDDVQAQQAQEAAANESEAQKSAALQRQLEEQRAAYEAEIAELREVANARAAENAPGRVRNSVRRPQTKVRSFDKSGKDKGVSAGDDE